jgi:5'-3' exonuclease
MNDIQQNPILIVDGLNLFIRSYSAYPAMSTHGYQMGGCVGFLKTLKRIVFEMQPSAIYICWESGGSQKRRKLHSEYKLNRRPDKMNRFYEDDIPESDDNQKHQLIALLAMIKYAPACQIYVQDCEGDDVIAYLCRGRFRTTDKIIASSDKDMYQLVDEKTRVYSFHKKAFVKEEDVLGEFRVTAQNFAMAKTLCGDPSDNIPGIKGLGFKTIAKLFPFLGSEEAVLLQDVLNYAEAHKEENHMYKRILDNKDVVQRNWKLVYLDGGMLTAIQSAQVDNIISTFTPKIDKVGLVKQLVKEGLGNFDVEDFFYSFNGLK